MKTKKVARKSVWVVTIRGYSDGVWCFSTLDKAEDHVRSLGYDADADGNFPSKVHFTLTVIR